jgi:hypothetical protein
MTEAVVISNVLEVTTLVSSVRYGQCLLHEMITFIIPAHDEELLVGRTISALQSFGGICVITSARDLQAIGNHGCLYHRLTRFYVATPAEPYFHALWHPRGA